MSCLQSALHSLGCIIKDALASIINYLRTRILFHLIGCHVLTLSGQQSASTGL